MSTAVAEPPVATEAPAAAPAVDIQSLLKPSIIPKGQTTPINNPAPKAEAPPEAKKETPKDASKEPAKEKPAENTPEHSWAELRKKSEAAEEARKALEVEHAKLREEYESFKKNPVPKEVHEKLTAAEKRAQEMQSELRAAALHRDPDFQRKYNEPIKGAMDRMEAVAVAAGIDPKEVKAAFASWNVEAFGQWAEAMTPGQKWDLQAAYQEAVRLDNERNRELSDAERAYEEREKARMGEQEKIKKQRADSLRGETNAIMEELLGSQEIVKSDESLRGEVLGLMERAAGLNGDQMTSKQILANLAKGHVLARHFERVEKERAELTEKLASVEKTLAERNEFIKSINGSIPTPGPTQAMKSAGDEKELVNKLLHPSVRG